MKFCLELGARMLSLRTQNGGGMSPKHCCALRGASLVVIAMLAIATGNELTSQETSDVNQRVRALIEGFRSDSARVREASLYQLLAIGEPAVPLLLEAAVDAEKTVQLSAIETLGQIGALAGARSAVSAMVRFVAYRAFDRIPFRVQVVPLYLINALSASLIGTVALYPVHFLLWLPNGASRGVLRVGSMAQAMEDSDEEQASATAALIGAGHDVGRIVGPAVGGLVAAAVGLSTMFVVMPIFFVALILPLTMRVRPGDPPRN